jgi:serine/threonine protein kinase
MNDSLWRRARVIFEQAIEVDEGRQMAFVHQACGADQPLLAEVIRMIEADRRHTPMLDQPVFHWGVMSETTLEKSPGALPFNYIGNYRLIRKLGEGGMGEVYIAVEEPVDRKVAIKLMLTGLDEEFMRRFNDERKALASLNQRNIVTMFASGEANGRPYFVMEYLEGESLRQRMSREHIPLREIAEITGQICDALNAAHNRGIVHRDIKPENIFLARDDDGLLVKVLDFGIATLKESETRTATRSIIGTAAYLSPEQARGLSRKEIDGRVDVYSLGVVVYEMLTGLLPFTAMDVDGYLYMHLNVTPPRPSARASGTGITDAMDYVVMRALAKDPDERQQTAREFARSLKEAVEKSPPPLVEIETQPATPVEVETQPVMPPWKPFLSRIVLPLAIVLLLGAGGWWAVSHFNQSPGRGIIDESSGGGQENPRAPNPAPTVSLDPKVEIEQERKGVVSPETSFKSGDAVRLIVSPNQSGRVYIVMKGTTGPAEILYPDPRIKVSDGAVQANERVEMPPSNSEMPWFQFDNRPGVETLYIVFATQKGDENLQSLESAVQQKRRQLNDTEEGQIVAALDALAAGQKSSPIVAAKKILLRHNK